MSLNFCTVKRCFKPYQNEHNSVKDTGEKGKKPCNIELKINMKILFHCPPTHLPFLSSNPEFLKAFLKNVSIKMKPTKCQAKEKMKQEKQKKRGLEKAKSRSQNCCVKPNFCFLLMPELRKLIFCTWIRRPRSVRPVNVFVVSFSSL